MRYRLVIFIILSSLILLGYQYYFMPRPSQLQEGEKVLETQAVTENTGESQTITRTETQKQPQPLLPSPKLEDSVENIKDAISDSTDGAEDRKIEVETEVLNLVFSEKGGYIEEVTLKKFSTEKTPVKLFENSYYGAVFFSGDLEKKASSFVFEGPSKIVLRKGETRELVFKTKADGVEIEKRFSLKGAEYTIDMLLGLRNGSEDKKDISEQIILGPQFFHMGEETKDRYAGHIGPVVSKSGKPVREKLEDLESSKIFSGDVEWAGMESKYFLASIKLPDKDYSVALFPEEKKMLTIGAQSKFFSLKPLESVKVKYPLYVGPKYYNVLEKQGLGNAVDFGWFGILGKPLLVALNWIYSYLGNYGFSIVIITIILKIIFFPLTQKSFTSMQQMKNIQPQIKAIRDKYKKDSKKMNEETMALYKEQGVNPMGGCLPMVLQIPVFIAFYNVLLNSVELMGAPFFWWMKDLSQKDPYYITPILMGVTMLLQQKMTPTAGDPRQAQIMMIMPVVFTFMFMSFPVGLVIYWTVNNILTIAQQYFMMPKDSESEAENSGKSRSARKKKAKGKESAKKK